MAAEGQRHVPHLCATGLYVKTAIAKCSASFLLYHVMSSKVFVYNVIGSADNNGCHKYLHRILK